MTHRLIVPDANIFAKLLHPEPDSPEAKVFFKTCVATGAKLVVPELFKYEIAEVTRYHKGSLAKTLDLLDAHLNAIMTVSSPDRDSWLLAEEITQKGHDKSGFPTIYDSIYHALAIRMDGTFLTADCSCSPDKGAARSSICNGSISILKNATGHCQRR